MVVPRHLVGGNIEGAEPILVEHSRHCRCRDKTRDIVGRVGYDYIGQGGGVVYV